MSLPEKETSTPPSSFESQRDQLLQEITAAMNSVVFNLGILSKSLEESIEVGSDFQNASKLWANFYSGLNSESPRNIHSTDGDSDEQAASNEAAGDSGVNTDNPKENASLEQSENVPVIESISEQTATERSATLQDSGNPSLAAAIHDAAGPEQNENTPRTP